MSTVNAGAALDLIDRSRATLLAACHAETTTDRFVQAHLGALRAAAAVVAARPRARRRLDDVWATLASVAPEMSEWAAYFAAVGERRSRVEIGVLRVSARECDDTLRAAETFMCLVQAALGLPVQRADSWTTPVLVP